MKTTEERILELTTRLVECASPSHDIGANEACMKIVTDLFKDTKWTVEEFRKTPTSAPTVLIAPRAGTRHARVLFLAHIDVVPMSDYGVRVETGAAGTVLYGRGVSDMKGPTATLLQIMLEMDVGKTDLCAVIVSDEEIGGIDCAKYVFSDEDGPKINCDVCVCPDGGDGFKLVTHEKGVLRAELSAQGTAAHSAYPWLGRNAIEMLMGDLARVRDARTGDDADAPLVFDSAGPQWHTTMQPTLATAGAAINQVPAAASAKLDMRFTEEWTVETLKAKVASVVEQCSVDFFFAQPMLVCPKESQWMRDAAQVVAKHTAVDVDAVQYSRGHGTSDGHWAPFPVVMYKPVGGGLHQVDEWVDFESLITYYHITKELTLLWATKQ